MSEYWKSTPKYWCKYCKTYVRDSILERQGHDATPRHQGNLKRFLRDLHRGTEREARDQERAKRELDRLNGIVSTGSAAGGGASSSSGPGGPGAGSKPPPGRQPGAPFLNQRQREPTADERKRQLAQLAGMGVAVPQEYRREMAMPGEWQTLSERSLIKTEEEEAEEKRKANIPKVAPRKRKADDDEEEILEEAPVAARRKGWGSSFRTYPGATDESDADLDALLSSARPKGHSGGGEPSTETDQHQDNPRIKSEPSLGDQPFSPARNDSEPPPSTTKHSDHDDIHALRRPPLPDTAPAPEVSEQVPFFKKRKAKPTPTSILQT